MFNEASAHKSATLPLLRLNRSARAISPSDGKTPFRSRDDATMFCYRV